MSAGIAAEYISGEKDTFIFGIKRHADQSGVCRVYIIQQSLIQVEIPL